MLSAEELRRLKSIPPSDIANALGIDFRPTIRGGMLPAIWRGENHSSVSYLKSSQGHWYWTDFGTGEGGSQIDLVMKQLSMSYIQAIYQLQKICHGYSADLAPISFSFSLPFSKPSKSSWKIQSIRSCEISDINVLEKQRHLSSDLIPLDKLKWITIMHRQKKFLRECYGIINSSGGYELFSGYPSCHSLSFKSCCGKKDISVINRNARNWVICESLIDTMSVQQMYGESLFSLISLNGVTQVDRVGAFLAKYHSRIERLVLALDHDSPGEIAQEKIIGFCKQFRISFEILNYTGKDPNDALKSHLVCEK
jgi:hypothetical protein